MGTLSARQQFALTSIERVGGVTQNGGQMRSLCYMCLSVCAFSDAQALSQADCLDKDVSVYYNTTFTSTTIIHETSQCVFIRA